MVYYDKFKAGDQLITVSLQADTFNTF